jgi:hypothetical protein
LKYDYIMESSNGTPQRDIYRLGEGEAQVNRYNDQTIDAANRSTVDLGRGAGMDIAIGALSVLLGLMGICLVTVYYSIETFYTLQTGFIVYSIPVGVCVFMALIIAAPLSLGLRAFRIGQEKKRMSGWGMDRPTDDTILGFSVLGRKGSSPNCARSSWVRTNHSW